ncbi:type VI secretion system baseplate subunit TssF [Xanthomonas campestris]|uniref:type VI secretion system baseplate subunit TssF n=1 Tax=Xanthomonas campestris TaxID=339 RepID=UPI001E43A982|nr:type VI secretion system baseplate subunit TssF [Xanthomonas campestris]MCC5068983.1 type VI secretion system baseplate subunit TssF [Xanthomonas campestris]
MDPRLLPYYSRELQHVRDMGAEFAREYPKIAGRLGLDAFECADPYVERLLEGFAFLAARVQLKLDAQYPVFTQHLLEMVYPHYLAPLPSMAVVQLQPDLKDSGLAAGVAVPRHSALRSLIGTGERTACEFRTAHAVTLWPLQLTEAKYLDSPAALAAAGVAVPPGRSVRAGIRLRLEVVGGAQAQDLALDALPLFLAGADGLPKRLYEQLHGDCAGVVVRGSDAGGVTRELLLDADALRTRGFADDDALIPYDGRSFSGYRLLQEYFACPERFLFAELTGLRAALRRLHGSSFEIVVLLERSVPALAAAVSAEHFKLFCTPAINLFERRADRIHLHTGRHDYHVLADRTRPMDFEIHHLGEVEGFGDRQESEQRYTPFYGGDARTWHARHGAFYTMRREPRLLSARQRRDGARSSYVGSEVFVSLVDADDQPHSTRLRQLGLQLWCSNRDLPLHMPVGKGSTDFSMDSGVPVQSVRCVAGPTKPRPALSDGQTAWRLLSQLQLNYLSLFDEGPGESTSAAALREILTLYCDPFDASAQRQIEGIKQVRGTPIVRRIPVPGPITFGRGLQITLTCEDAAFEGTGAFLLASVLRHFFARYVSVNAFTETVLRTTERNEVARWPAQPGSRPRL